MDNEKILNKVKMKIAISKINEEDIVMKKNRFNISKKMGMVACLLIVTTGIVFASSIQNLLKNSFGDNASEGVQTAIDNGYIQNVVDPIYIESDGIEIAVDSFLIDDYNFDMNFSVNLDKKYNSEEMRGIIFYDMKVVDENKDIVFLTTEAETIMAKEQNREVGQNYHPLFWGGYGMYAESIGENSLMFHLTAYGSEEHKFPKSKKLYVTFSTIQKDPFSNEFYTGNWNFELDVPQEMYNRETIIYKVKSCSDSKTKVGDATLSNTAFKINILETTTDKIDYDLIHTGKDISEKRALGNEYVENSEGKRFETSQRSDGDGGYSLASEPNLIVNYSQTFNLTKFDATDELKVHIFTNRGEEIIIEYEKSK